jgi:hypothetical protein
MMVGQQTDSSAAAGDGVGRRRRRRFRNYGANCGSRDVTITEVR